MRAWIGARHLGVEPAPHKEPEFEDGESEARSQVGIRGGDAYIVQSLHGGWEQSPHDKLCRLLFFIGALRDTGAVQVTAVAPYVAYALKDHRTKSRDPVTTRYVAELLEAVGLDRIVAMDVHNLAAHQNALRCRSEHLEACGLFAGDPAARSSSRLADPGSASRGHSMTEMIGV